MKRKDIFRQLNSEFDRLTPEMSDRVKNEPIVAARKVFATEKVPVAADGAAGTHSPFFTPKRVISLAVAVVLLITAAVLLVWTLAGRDKYRANDGFISLKISAPTVVTTAFVTTKERAATNGETSFSIVTDSDGNAVKVTANDRNAEILLAGVSAAYAEEGKTLTGSSQSEVVNVLTEISRSLGYFGAGGAVDIMSVSVRGDEVSRKAAASLGESAQTAAGSGAVVTAVAGSKENLQAELGISDPCELSDLLDIAASRGGYLETSAEKLFSRENGSAEAYNAYLFELLEEYFDLLEDRGEALAELDEICEEIRSEIRDMPGGYFIPVLVNGKLNPEIEIDDDLKESFEEALSECGETGFVPSNDTELSAWNMFFGILEDQSDLIEEILEEVEEKFSELAQALDKIYALLENTLVGFNEEMAKIRAEWQEWKGGIDQTVFAEPEDFVEYMTEAFEREFERIRNGN